MGLSRVVTSWLVFDPWDFRITRAFLVLVAVVGPVALTGPTVARWMTGQPLLWTGELAMTGGRVTAFSSSSAPLVPTNDPAPPPGVWEVEGGTSTFAVADAGAGLWLAVLVPDVVASIGLVVVAALLSRLLRRIEDHEPFVLASATTLRWVALTVLATLTTGVAATVAADLVVVGETGLALLGEVAVTLVDGSSVLLLCAALLCAALAEAFAPGARLRQDLDGLV